MKTVAYVLLFTCCGLVIFFVAMATTTRTPANTVPHPLTDDQRTWETLRVRVPAMDMSVRVMRKEHLAMFGRVRGVAMINRNPCEIAIPEGWYIDAKPARGDAWFASSENANTLAHEMLHCVVGQWHR